MVLSSPPRTSRRSDEKQAAVEPDTTRLQRLLSTIREERARLQRNIALRNNAMREDCPSEQQDSGSGAVGGSGGRGSERGRSVLASLETDSSQDEHATVTLVSCHPASRSDEPAVFSTLLADSASIHINLKPSFDLQWIKSELNEKFTCELCTDIIASPHSLRTCACKHVFCAICLLRWILKDFLDGAWSSSIQCPSCSTTIPRIPMQTPRDPTTFPLVPNLVALKMLHAYTTVLSDAGDAFLYGIGGTDHNAPGDVDDDTLAWVWAMPAVRHLRTREREGEDFVRELRDHWVDANAAVFASFKVSIDYEAGDSAVPSECDESALALTDDQHPGDDISMGDDKSDGQYGGDIDGVRNDGDHTADVHDYDDQLNDRHDAVLYSDEPDDGVEYDDNGSGSEQYNAETSGAARSDDY